MQILHTISTFAKRDGTTHYSLYIVCIMLGCILCCLIGFAGYSMYHGSDETPAVEVPYEQRKYMREVHQRNLNRMAITARRPDMIIPVEELNY
ncbi:hypothetical protein N7520_010014 [Penicillium odoratum]|uniref:uncharacterized protein n=1 Tax=Penicillium odoratum TaxID=1167516 RepID=UPI0025472379|nr:uncharacterized protein N7520_010014 [Penicillium odoratum]KAJ5753097.1 hypothetical protein N7520_010014 [Penicillium odoratum]